jgi:hypothetical protein
VLVVYFTHKMRVARAQCNQFVLNFVKILARLIDDDLDDPSLHRADVLKKLKSVVTADHVVLEDVVDHLYVRIDIAMDDGADAAHFLHANAKFEHAAVLDKPR